MFSILTKIDEKLDNLGIEINHRKSFICVIVSIIVFGVYTIGSLTFLILKDGIDISRLSVIVIHVLPY